MSKLVNKHYQIYKTPSLILLRGLFLAFVSFFFSCSPRAFVYTQESRHVILKEFCSDYEFKIIKSSCSINVTYPQVNNLKNEAIQNKINKRLKEEFLTDVNNYCNEDLQDTSTTQVEISYTSYISSNLLSIMSSEIYSFDIVAGLEVKSYNIDINTGRFLELKALFDLQYKEEVAQIIIDKVFSVYDKDKSAENLHKYYSSIKEDIFNRFQVQVLRDSIIFRFRGESEIEPIYYAEISRKDLKKHINNKSLK